LALKNRFLAITRAGVIAFIFFMQYYNTIVSTTSDYSVDGELTGYHTTMINLSPIEGLIAVIITIAIFTIILLRKKTK
jgi:Sec-independent protein secretion pathway component TatC